MHSKATKRVAGSHMPKLIFIVGGRGTKVLSF